MTEFESEKKNKTEFHEATQAKQIKKKNKISNKIPKRKIREVGFCKNLWKFSAVR